MVCPPVSHVDLMPSSSVGAVDTYVGFGQLVIQVCMWDVIYSPWLCTCSRNIVCMLLGNRCRFAQIREIVGMDHGLADVLRAHVVV